MGNSTSVLRRLRKQLCGRRRAGTRRVDFVAERFEKQSFDRCDAAPQFLASKELDVFIEVHMDDVHGTGPRPTPSVAGSVKQKPDEMLSWTCKSAASAVDLLGACKTCQLIVQSKMNACAKEMKQPTKASWTRLKRLARYLADPHEALLRVRSDSDWVGKVKDRKSQSCLKIDVDGCPLHSASRKQKARGHSSFEAEYYAAASATSETMLIREVLLVMGLEVRTESCWTVQQHVAHVDV